MTPNRSLLLPGLALVFRRFPALLWASVFGLIYAALNTTYFAAAVGNVTDTSLAAAPLHRGFDLSAMASLAFKLSEGPGLRPTFSTTVLLYVATYFLLVPVTLLCYQT